MTVSITDVSTFTDPVLAPDDGDPATGAVFQLSPQALSNRTRWLKDLSLGVKPLSAPSFQAQTGYGAANDSGLLFTSSGNLSTLQSAVSVWRALEDVLVNGCTISSVSVRVKPGAARSGANRMSAILKKRSHATAVVSWTDIGTASFDAGTTAAQVITFAAAEVVNLATTEYALVIVTGNDSDTNDDTIYGASVTLS